MIGTAISVEIDAFLSFVNLLADEHVTVVLSEATLTMHHIAVPVTQNQSDIVSLDLSFSVEYVVAIFANVPVAIRPTGPRHNGFELHERYFKR